MILALNDELKEIKSCGRKLTLIEKLSDKNIQHIRDNIQGDYLHMNYLEYLQIAWDCHYSVVVNPDIIWYMLLCEIAQIVAIDPKKYQNLFSRSQEKVVIFINTVSPDTMPLDQLTESLSFLVPTDINLFLPKFSTSGKNAVFSKYAAFSDIVSPYYNYMMYACGFPAIDVQGIIEDWQLVSSNWKSIGEVLKVEKEYFDRVQDKLDEAMNSLNDKDFWKKMFWLEQCGSGSDVYMEGWLKDLYRVKDKMPRNMASHVSLVKYENFLTKRKFQMKQGLFSSVKENGFLKPDFGCIVYEENN
jgi:Domain of unknown function (DUF4419)